MTLRRGREALLRGTALQAAFVLLVVLPGAARPSPAAAQPAPGARPQGGQVVAGTAAIDQINPAVTRVGQTSPRAAIDWRSFDVGRDHAVVFTQPGSSAVVLNRVTGPDPSAIAGRIQANGQVVITNPSGVVFHRGAQVDAQALVVSAAGITNQNFMAGRMVFDQHPRPDARVENRGTITVREAGLAALVAPQVSNSGTINAKLGRAVLGGAETHTLDLYGDGLLSLDVTNQVRQVPRGPDGQPVQALVTNTGTIVAEGGTVQLTAAAADGLVQTLVRAGGQVTAPTLAGRRGRIELSGTGGSVIVEGLMQADGTGPSDPGGEVVAMASGTVAVAGGAQVSASGYGGGTVALGTTPARAAAGRAAALAPPGGPALGVPAGTARRVVVAPGARVAADGRGTGRGGTVAVLSTHETRVAGQVSARGGEEGGDGGVVEASSAGVLRLDAAPDVAAPRGRGGTVFLDPEDLVIGTGPTQAPFDPAGSPNTPADEEPRQTGTSYVSPSTLTRVSRGSTVRLQARNDLTVAESVDLSAGTGSPGGASLDLQAGRDVRVNPNVRIRVDGDLILSAGSGNATASRDPAGSVRIGAGSELEAGIRVSLTSGSAGAVVLDRGSVIGLGASVTAADIRIDIDVASGTGGTLIGGSLRPGRFRTVDLNSTGAVTQTATGAVVTDTLTGTASSYTLTSRNNQIRGVRTLTATAGDVELVSGIADGVLDMVVGQSSLGGGISVPAGRSVTLTTDGLTVGPSVGGGSATTISAPGGTITVQPYTAGLPVELGNGGSDDVRLSVTQEELGRMRAATLRLGSATAGNLTVVAPGGTMNVTAPPGAPSGSDNGFAALDLSSGGSITQSGSLVVGTLTARGSSVALDSPDNRIGTLAGATSGGVLTVRNGAALVVSGPISGGAVTVSSTDNLTVRGLVTGTTVDLAGTVRLQAGNNLTVSSGVNLAAGPGSPPGGSLALQAGNDVTLDADVTLGASPGPGIPAPSLTLQAGHQVVVGTPTRGSVRVSAEGDVTFLAGDRTVADLFAPGVVGDSRGGSVSVRLDSTVETKGALRFQAAGRAGLEGDSLGRIDIDRNVRLIAGPAPSGNGVSAGDTGLILLAATDVDVGPGSVLQLRTDAGSRNPALTLQAGRNIGLGSGAQVQAGGGELRLSAGDPAPATTVVASGGAPTDPFDPAGSVRVGDGVALAGGAAVSLFSGDAGAVVLQAGSSAASTASRVEVRSGTGGTAIGGTLAAGPSSAVVLTSGGAVTQADTGAVVASDLAGTASSYTLTSRNNRVANVGGGPVGSLGATAGDVSLVDAVDLVVVGRVSLGGGISVPAGRSVTLTTDGLTVGSGSSAGGGPATAISAPGGTIAVQPYTAGRTVELQDGATKTPGALSITQAELGRLQAATVRLGSATAGDLTVAPGGGTVAVTAPSGSPGGGFAALDLRSGGAITQGAGSGLVARGLTANGAEVRLTGPANEVRVLGPSAATAGDFALTTNLAAGSGSTGGGASVPLTLEGGVAVPAGRTIALTADRMAVAGPAPSLSSPGGTVALAPLTPGRPVELIASGLPDATALSIGPDLLAAIGTGTLQLGRPETGAIRLGNTGDAIGLGGRAATLRLLGAGAVTQGGTLAVGTLTGQTASAALNGANTVGTLGAFATTGGFSLVNAAALRVAGPVTDPASIALRTNAGDLVLAGPVSTPAPGVLGLFAEGGVVQVGGAVTAGTLTGAAGAGATLGQAGNRITALRDFRSGGDVQVSTATDLSITGAVRAGAGRTLSLSAGQVTLTPDAVLSAPGGTVALAPLGEDVGFVLSGTGPTGSAVDARTLRIGSPQTGPVRVSGTFNLAGANVLDLRSGASVTQDPGSAIQAGTLTGQAPTVALEGANRIGEVRDLRATAGALSLNNRQSLLVTGDVGGSDVRLTAAGDIALGNAASAGTLSASGTATVQADGGTFGAPNGAVAAGVLRGNARDVALTGANRIGTLGDFSTSGALDLTNGQALRIAGSLSAGSLDIRAPGSITQTGTTRVVGSGGGTATLRLQLLGGGGTMRFNDLQAGGVGLTLDLGTGFASGTVAARSLLVIGSGGGSDLSGQVAGLSGGDAARAARIQPGVDRAYLFNDCVIQSCAPPIDPGDFQSFLSPQGILESVYLARQRDDLYTLIFPPLATLVPEPEDQEVLLPNISDRDD